MPSLRHSKTNHFWKNRLRFKSFQLLVRIYRVDVHGARAARYLPSNLLMCGHTRGHESKENIRAILRLPITKARANATEFPAQQRCASSAVGDGPTIAWEIAANTSYRVEHKVNTGPSLP